MAKFDFDKPVASFSWYLQNGSTDDKRGNRLHVGTGQNAQIYFDPKSGEFIGKLKYVDDYIDLADGAKQHFELPRTAREYKPSDFSPTFPISNVKFEVDESVKDFIHVLPRGLFFYQNEFYDAVFGDKTDYPESLKDFLFTRTGDIETAGEFYGAIEKWPQSVYGTLVEKCNVENRPIPEYENDRALPLDYHKELLASLKDHFGCGESNYRTPGDLIAARSYGSYLSGISLRAPMSRKRRPGRTSSSSIIRSNSRSSRRTTVRCIWQIAASCRVLSQTASISAIRTASPAI